MSNILEEIKIILRGDTSKLVGDFKGAGTIMENLIGQFSLGHIAKGMAGIAAGYAGMVAPLELVHAGIAKWNEGMAMAKHAADEQAKADGRLRAALIATNYHVGLSFEELKEQASELQLATAVGGNEIEEAMVKMLAFGNVQQDEFKRAVHAAIEWSQFMGTSVVGSANMLAKMLENPTRGMHMLARAGVTLSKEQKELIENMMRLGKVSEAQGVILDAVEKKYGKFAETNMSSNKRLRVEIENMREELGFVIKQFDDEKLRGEKWGASFQLGFGREVSENWQAMFGGVGDDTTRFFENLGAQVADAFGRAFARSLRDTLLSIPTGMFIDQARAVGDFKGLIGGMPEKKKPGEDRPKPGDKVLPDRKEVGEGFFDPVQFAKKVQESMLGKNDRLVELAEEQKNIQMQMLNELQGAAVADPLPVANP